MHPHACSVVIAYQHVNCCCFLVQFQAGAASEKQLVARAEALEEQCVVLSTRVEQLTNAKIVREGHLTIELTAAQSRIAGQCTARIDMFLGKGCWFH